MNDYRALVESCLALGIPEPKLPPGVSPSQLGTIAAALKAKRTEFEKLRELESRAKDGGVEIEPLLGTAKRKEVEERIAYLEDRIRLAEAAEWDGDVPPEEEI